MCAIVGSIVNASMAGEAGHEMINRELYRLWMSSHERGRDGRGYFMLNGDGNGIYERSIERRDPTRAMMDIVPTTRGQGVFSLIGNMRAEPTTEWVENKSIRDQQPYGTNNGKWVIVHNGTIANDKELRADNPADRYPTSIDSAAILEQLNQNDGQGTPQKVFGLVVRKLVGSFAILAVHTDNPDRIFFACNYRPIWWTRGSGGVHIASAREYLPGDNPRMVPPYSVGYFSDMGISRVDSLLPQQGQDRALVVCSGGLDSVVAASEMVRRLGKENVELIHFQYGSRAEGPEEHAVLCVAEALNVPVVFKKLPVYSPGDSNLLDSEAKVAGGEQGAEYAHEWVPARNLLLIAVATAYAEAKGFTVLCLGNNLEEAGAYPDNEPEFIRRIGDLLPFAVGDGVRLRIEQPVGNLMKHEIVALGLKNGAPIDKTWSCYRSGKLHCGTCGPCFMRKTAFAINKKTDPMEYEQ